MDDCVILTGWKILLGPVAETKPGLFHSATRWHRMDYRVGEWTCRDPECGPLCLFDSMYHAREFGQTTMAFLQTWIAECQYEPAEVKAYGAIWCTAPSGMKYDRSMYSLPAGTLLAERIMIAQPEALRRFI